MDGDLILHWLSSRKYGKLSDVASAVSAVMEGAPGEKVYAARSYLRRLEVMGHLDQLWPEGKWSIRQTTVTQLPGSAAFALVVGQRSPELESLLESEMVLHKVENPSPGAGSLSDPRTLILEYDDEAALREIALDAGAEFVSCAANSVSENLPLLGLGSLAGGPNTHGSPIEMFNIRTGKFITIETPSRDGMFKQKVNGRFVYWLLRAGIWYSTTYSEGICLTKAEIDDKCLELRIVENSDESIGTLRVDKSLPLPMSHIQGLVLCSGFHPKMTSDGSWMYENIPNSVANAIAHSVHQRLQIV